LRVCRTDGKDEDLLGRSDVVSICVANFDGHRAPTLTNRIVQLPNVSRRHFWILHKICDRFNGFQVLDRKKLVACQIKSAEDSKPVDPSFQDAHEDESGVRSAASSEGLINEIEEPLHAEHLHRAGIRHHVHVA
jgi:hypothetical protein